MGRPFDRFDPVRDLAPGLQSDPMDTKRLTNSLWFRNPRTWSEYRTQAVMAPLVGLLTLGVIALIADDAPWTTLIILGVGSWALSLAISAVRLRRRRD